MSKTKKDSLYFFAYVGTEDQKRKIRLDTGRIIRTNEYNGDPRIALQDPKIRRSLRRSLHSKSHLGEMIYAVYAKVGDGTPIKIHLPSHKEEQLE